MPRRIGIIAAQTLLGAGLLAAWLWIVDLGAVAETLAQAKWGYVLLAGVTAGASTLIRTMRWRLVLKPITLVPRLDILFISLASSLVNYVIPIRSGELARGSDFGLLSHCGGRPIAGSVSSSCRRRLWSYQWPGSGDQKLDRWVERMLSRK